jgi:hypothetical protein
MLVSQAFTKSPQKTKQRASIELGISRRSLSCLIQWLDLKIYWPRLLHVLLQDDRDRRLQFCEVVLKDEKQGSDTVDKFIDTTVSAIQKKSPCIDRKTVKSAGE